MYTWGFVTDMDVGAQKQAAGRAPEVRSSNQPGKADLSRMNHRLSSHIPHGMVHAIFFKRLMALWQKCNNLKIIYVLKEKCNIKDITTFLVPVTVDNFLREKHAEYPGKCSLATGEAGLFFSFFLSYPF